MRRQQTNLAYPLDSIDSYEKFYFNSTKPNIARYIPDNDGFYGDRYLRSEQGKRYGSKRDQ